MPDLSNHSTGHIGKIQIKLFGTYTLGADSIADANIWHQYQGGAGMVIDTDNRRYTGHID